MRSRNTLATQGLLRRKVCWVLAMLFRRHSCALLLLLLCCILLLLVDLSQVMWGPSRHLGSLTAANWVSFDFNVSYFSCWGYSLINTLKLKNKRLRLNDIANAIDCNFTQRSPSRVGNNPQIPGGESNLIKKVPRMASHGGWQLSTTNVDCCAPIRLYQLEAFFVLLLPPRLIFKFQG